MKFGVGDKIYVLAYYKGLVILEGKILDVFEDYHYYKTSCDKIKTPINVYRWNILGICDVQKG